MKTLSATVWLLSVCLAGFAPVGRCASVTGNLCCPSPEIQAALEKAAAVGVANPMATEQALAPFRALRARFPDNLFVHEGYQEAVQRYGVEGQLKTLTEEYAVLDGQHNGDPMYHYLYLRSLVGYSTKAAIQGLREMAAQDPDFAPAHQALAEIYGSVAFRDAAQENSERTQLLRLCPKATVSPLPPPLPGPSSLNDQAARLLAQHGDPARLIVLTTEGIGVDEWRWQHIHPHDWYTDDEKRRTLRDLRAEYWKAWSTQVRCDRLMGQPDKAAGLLARMDASADSFLAEAGHQYWNALATLVQLYAEGDQRDQATQKLTMMKDFLVKNPDRDGAAQIKALETMVTALK